MDTSTRPARIVLKTKNMSRRSPLSAREEKAAYLFLMPWFIGLTFFLAVPLVWSLYISMTDKRLISAGGEHFIGLQNYTYMFTQDGYFYHSLYVTLKWLVLTTPLYLLAGLFISLLLNQKLPGIHLFRTILYIPAVLSGVAVAVLWLQLFNPELGAINYLLYRIGIDNPPYWLQDPKWAMPAVIIMGLWGVGGTAIIYLAGLQNIPPHLYEAASIDGAGSIAKFFYITLPMLSPTIFFLLVNAIIDSLLIFGPVFVLGGDGGPEDSLLFYMLYLYRRAFIQGLMGYATALAWVLTILGVILVFLMFRFERRFVFYEAAE